MKLLEISDTGLAYMLIGGFVVCFIMVSLMVKEKLYINEVILGTLCGIIFGPFCANVLNPRTWGGDANLITLEIMRITLAIGLFAIGFELPARYLVEHVRGLLFMVVPTMAFGWLIVAGIIYLVFPSLDYVSSLVIAACLTPTDPIISAAIVGGDFATKNVREDLRNIISAESASNDGLAYPFLSISIYLTIEQSRTVAIGKWFLVGWLYQVILGTIIGGILGLVFSRLIKLSDKKAYTDRRSRVTQYLALALFTVGFTRTVGSDDLLAALAAGLAVKWDNPADPPEEGAFAVVDLVLNCACFLYIGAWMPFNMFNAVELGITPCRLVVLFVAVVFLRRIPPLLLLYKFVPEINGWREALFSGHFGPMGVGAIFISTLAVTELPTPHSPPQNQAELLAATLQPIVSFIVLGSIIIHGLSIPFFSFGQIVHSRTVSLTRTWTSRNTHTREWLYRVRRTSSQVTHLDMGGSIDIEQGREDSIKAKNVGTVQDDEKGGEYGYGNVAETPAETVIYEAIEERVMTSVPSSVSRDVLRMGKSRKDIMSEALVQVEMLDTSDVGVKLDAMDDNSSRTAFPLSSSSGLGPTDTQVLVPPTCHVHVGSRACDLSVTKCQTSVFTGRGIAVDVFNSSENYHVINGAHAQAQTGVRGQNAHCSGAGVQ